MSWMVSRTYSREVSRTCEKAGLGGLSFNFFESWLQGLGTIYGLDFSGLGFGDEVGFMVMV